MDDEVSFFLFLDTEVSLPSKTVACLADQGISATKQTASPDNGATDEDRVHVALTADEDHNVRQLVRRGRQCCAVILPTSR